MIDILTMCVSVFFSIVTAGWIELIIKSRAKHNETINEIGLFFYNYRIQLETGQLNNKQSDELKKLGNKLYIYKNWFKNKEIKYILQESIRYLALNGLGKSSYKGKNLNKEKYFLVRNMQITSALLNITNNDNMNGFLKAIKKRYTTQKIYQEDMKKIQDFDLCCQKYLCIFKTWQLRVQLYSDKNSCFKNKDYHKSIFNSVFYVEYYYLDDGYFYMLEKIKKGEIKND